MPALDDYLRNELRRTVRPVDVNDVSSKIDLRRIRRARVQKVKVVALAVFILAGTVAGVAVLSKAFPKPTIDRIGDASPVPNIPRANGVIVAAQRNDGGPLRLVSVNPDGSGREVIPTNVDPAEVPWLSAWSPDGTKLAVAMAPADYGPLAIWVMNADGSDPIKIAEATNVYQPSWSPDGTRIAYAADSQDGAAIHVVNADGTGDHVVGERLQRQHYYYASFSPDGTQILYDAGPYGPGYLSHIFVMDGDGTNITQLTSTGHDYSPSWSPDGSQIAFSRLESQGGSNIYVMDRDGSNVRQITNGPADIENRNATWSPDGTRIAYHASAVIDGPGSLVVMDSDGSHPVTILDGGVEGISWQPLLTASSSASPSFDLGLGFPVCDVSSFVDNWGGHAGAVYLATKMSDTGGCPAPSGGAFQVLGLDTTGDGKIDASYGPLECYPLRKEPVPCRLAGAADLNQDGTLEPIVVIGDTAGTKALQAFWASASSLEPISLCDGCAPGTAEWGGNQGHREGAYCDTKNGQPVFVTWGAELSDLQATEYAGTRHIYAFDGHRVTSLGTENFTVPRDRPDLFPPGGGDTLCGSRLNLGR